MPEPITVAKGKDCPDCPVLAFQETPGAGTGGGGGGDYPTGDNGAVTTGMGNQVGRGK